MAKGTESAKTSAKNASGERGVAEVRAAEGSVDDRATDVIG
jgi:hypothetical protein